MGLLIRLSLNVEKLTLVSISLIFLFRANEILDLSEYYEETSDVVAEHNGRAVDLDGDATTDRRI